jgi:hypothetical protein
MGNSPKYKGFLVIWDSNAYNIMLREPKNKENIEGNNSEANNTPK